MGDHWLDQASKTLARGVSRKGFLTLAGSLALTALVPRPRPAAGQEDTCPQGCDPPFSTCCGEHCFDVTSSFDHCGVCGHPCGEGEVCAGGQCVPGDRLGP